MSKESYADRAAREGGENEAMGSKEAQRILKGMDMRKASKRSSKRKSKR